MKKKAHVKLCERKKNYQCLKKIAPFDVIIQNKKYLNKKNANKLHQLYSEILTRSLVVEIKVVEIY